jgi:23S rRNA pseudouridine2605 synthase
VSGPLLDRDEEGLVRLHKLLARAGVASRRRCEELMLAGEVTVDNQVVTRLGTKVDPTTAIIRVSGTRLPPMMADPHADRILSELVADRPERLFHVGRLDTDTAGLLLLTNDGEFAQRMAHPSYEVDKTYVAAVEGVVQQRTLQQLLAGVTLEDGPVTVASAKLVGGHGTARDGSIVELVIHEGRNRIVRRLLDHVGHPVRQLTRTAIGPVVLGRLGDGELRDLTNDELGALLDAARL